MKYYPNGLLSRYSKAYYFSFWHDIPHATMMITLGADLYTVSKLLGHTNIQTTQIYAKIVDESKEKAIDLIPDIT